MIAVKGPYERLKYDLRRLFECPACHRRMRTSGAVTALVCRCDASQSPGGVPMRVVEDGARRVDAITVPARPALFGPSTQVGP